MTARFQLVIKEDKHAVLDTKTFKSSIAFKHEESARLVSNYLNSKMQDKDLELDSFNLQDIYNMLRN